MSQALFNIGTSEIIFIALVLAFFLVALPFLMVVLGRIRSRPGNLRISKKETPPKD